MRPKIVFVNSIPANTFGGGEKWFSVLAGQLSQKKYRVGLIARPGSKLIEKFTRFDCDIYSLKFGSDFNPISIVKLFYYFKKIKPDVLFLNFNKDVSIAGLAGRLAGVRKIIFRNGFPIIQKKWQHRILMPLVDTIIVNSLALKRYYLSFNWNFASKIKVIYNGIEIPEEKSVKVERTSETPFIILGAGRLTRVKQFDLFIKIITQLKNEFPVKAVLAGEGSELENLKQLSKSLDADIEFVGHVNSLMPFLQQADILLHTSRNEGMPNVILEAMATGVPVVATNAGGTNEMIEDGENGFLCEVGAIQCLVEKMKLLITTSDLMKRFSRAGLKTVRQKFNLERTIEQVEQLINT